MILLIIMASLAIGGTMGIVSTILTVVSTTFDFSWGFQDKLDKMSDLFLMGFFVLLGLSGVLLCVFIMELIINIV